MGGGDGDVDIVARDVGLDIGVLGVDPQEVEA